MAGVDHGRLFRSIDRWGKVGDELAGQEINRIVQKLTRSITGDFGAHSTRSGFATSAAEAGVPLDVIMGHTGHVDPASVMRYIRRAGRYKTNAATGLLGGARQ